MLLQGDVGLTKLLLELKADPNCPGRVNMPPLHIAAMCGFVDVLDVLIANGANVNAQDWVKFSPLHVACYFGHEKVTKSLFEHGANVNQPAGVKDVPIHLASAKGFINIVQLLVSQGADGNALSFAGFFCWQYSQIFPIRKSRVTGSHQAQARFKSESVSFHLSFFALRPNFLK